VHLDGDWHQTFHCWIWRTGADGRVEVILQRRSPLKDTFPGCWDAAAAGHWRFGETLVDAAREVAEELGLEVSPDRLTYAGREREARRFANGLVDRELQQVYTLEWPAPLLTYRPNAAEVSGLTAVPGRALVALAAGQVDGASATEAVDVLPDGSCRTAAECAVRPETFVPYSAARLRRLLRRIDGARR
jgi:isopentenyldiphosphate isomerase